MPSKKNCDTPSMAGATELEQAAAVWFVRRNRGLTPEEEPGFAEWLAADPEHERMLVEFGGTWELLGEARPVATAVPGQSPQGERRPRSQLRRVWLPLAGLAAALAVAYVGWWRPAYYSGSAFTEVGALRTLRLPDSTVLTLNTDSAISAAFSPGERRIRLERGEAHFVVAKNPARPFVVEVGGVLVRAVGTAFNVRIDPQTIAILVTEGKVGIDDSRSGQSLLAHNSVSDRAALTLPSTVPDYPVLSSGRKAVVVRSSLSGSSPKSVEETVTRVSPSEIERQMAWRDRRLTFLAAPLTDIVGEFNRYNRHKLIIGDPALATKCFGGSFKPDDEEGFVRMLQENFGVHAESSEEQTVLRIGQ